MHNLYSEGFICRLKIKLDIWGIDEFFYGVLQYLTNAHTSKVKLNHALDAPNTSCSKCNMKLKQKPGEEKLLISKQSNYS